MCKKIIIITGYVAAGKTTFSQQLSVDLGIPCINKDYIAVELGKTIEKNNRDDGKRISATAINMLMFIIEILMKNNLPLIIEGNLKHPNEETLKALLKKYDYGSLTYVFTGDLKILHKRFIERDNSPERDRLNKINGLLDDFTVFEQTIKSLGDFSVGDQIIKIDTTDFSKIDFKYYAKIGYSFIFGNQKDSDKI
jgi:dephospho-CoA kinase